MTSVEELLLKEMSEIKEQLSAINLKLETLLVPVYQQQGRQMTRMTDEERKAHNMAVLANAKRKALK